MNLEADGLAARQPQGTLLPARGAEGGQGGDLRGRHAARRVSRPHAAYVTWLRGLEQDRVGGRAGRSAGRGSRGTPARQAQHRGRQHAHYVVPAARDALHRKSRHGHGHRSRQQRRCGCWQHRGGGSDGGCRDTLCRPRFHRRMRGSCPNVMIQMSQLQKRERMACRMTGAVCAWTADVAERVFPRCQRATGEAPFRAPMRTHPRVAIATNETVELEIDATIGVFAKLKQPRSVRGQRQSCQVRLLEEHARHRKVRAAGWPLHRGAACRRRMVLSITLEHRLETTLFRQCDRGRPLQSSSQRTLHSGGEQRRRAHVCAAARSRRVLACPDHPSLRCQPSIIHTQGGGGIHRVHQGLHEALRRVSRHRQRFLRTKWRV